MCLILPICSCTYKYYYLGIQSNKVGKNNIKMCEWISKYSIHISGNIMGMWFMWTIYHNSLFAI